MRPEDLSNTQVGHPCFPLTGKEPCVAAGTQCPAGTALSGSLTGIITAATLSHRAEGDGPSLSSLRLAK